MNLQTRKEENDAKRERPMGEFNAQVKQRVDFEAKVAAWAIGLQQHAIYSYEFKACPKMSYSHDGEAEGLVWTISTGYSWQLIVSAHPNHGDDGIAYIRAELQSSMRAIREYESNKLCLQTESFEESAETAQAILDTFEGHVVAGWWPKERNEWARWIAAGKPKWRNGPPTEWVDEKGI